MHTMLTRTNVKILTHYIISIILYSFISFYVILSYIIVLYDYVASKVVVKFKCDP